MSTISPKSIQALIKKGVPTKEVKKTIKKAGKELVSRRDEIGQSVVHLVASEGDVEILHVLVDKMKANIEEKDKNGWRPLHCATVSGKIRAVEFLIKAGADVNAKTNEDSTVLHYLPKIAVPPNGEENLYVDLMDTIVGQSKDFEAKNKAGQTALHKAVNEKGNRTLLITRLLQHSASPNSVDVEGETPLHYTVRKGDVDLLALLLHYNADPLIVSPTSGTPLKLAKSLQFTKIAEIIQKHLESIGKSVIESEEGLESDDTLDLPKSESQPRLENDVVVDVWKHWQFKRQNIVANMLAKLQTYVSTLKFLVNIRDHFADLGLISKNEIELIFPSELSKFLLQTKPISKAIAHRVAEEKSDATTIGDILGQIQTISPLYKSFAGKIDVSLRTLTTARNNNSNFAAMLNKFNNEPILQHRTLHNLLFSPIEHISSFSQFLRDLATLTPAEHQDTAQVASALKTYDNIAKELIAVKKSTDSRAVILRIESTLSGLGSALFKATRELIYEGSAIVRRKQVPTNSNIYLFNDLLLWATKKGDKSTKGPSLQYQDSMYLSNVVSLNASHEDDKCTFEVCTDAKKATITVETEEARLRWVSFIGKYVSRASSNCHWLALEPKGNAPSRRVSQTATVVGSRMYLFGGNHQSTYYNDLFIFHIETREWMQLELAPPAVIPSPRCEHATVVVGSRIFLFGGFDGQTRLNDLYCFNTTSLSWVECKGPENAATPCGRSGHKMVHHKGLIYLFGGIDTQGLYLNDFHVYNIEKNTWREIAPTSSSIPPLPRAFHSMELLKNSIVIFGGYSFEKIHGDTVCYDIKNKIWMPTGDAMVPSNLLATQSPPTSPTLIANNGILEVSPGCRFNHASFVHSGALFIHGGCTSGTSSNSDLWALKVNETGIPTWSKVLISIQLDNRFKHATSIFKNRISGKYHVLIHGGFTGSPTASSASTSDIFIKDLDSVLALPDARAMSMSKKKQSMLFAVNSETKKSLDLLRETDQFEMSEIGDGPCGTVSVGSAREFPNFCVKTLTNARDVERFRDHFSVLQTCRHPGLVSFYHQLRRESFTFIVSDLMLCSVMDMMNERNHTPINHLQLAAIAQAVLEGLSYLHSKNVAHQNLHAGNVMVNTEGQIKLTDYGLPFDFKAETHFECPPEVEDGHPYSQKSDIYALGILLIHLIMVVPVAPQEVATTDLLAEDLRQFLALLLEESPEKRMDAKTLIDHPYLTDTLAHAMDTELESFHDMFVRYYRRHKMHSASLRGQLTAGGTTIRKKSVRRSFFGMRKNTHLAMDPVTEEGSTSSEQPISVQVPPLEASEADDFLPARDIASSGSVPNIMTQWEKTNEEFLDFQQTTSISVQKMQAEIRQLRTQLSTTQAELTGLKSGMEQMVESRVQKEMLAMKEYFINKFTGLGIINDGDISPTVPTKSQMRSPSPALARRVIRKDNSGDSLELSIRKPKDKVSPRDVFQ